MKIDFNYYKKDIDFTSGYILKGKNYRGSYVQFNSLYKNPAPGTEVIQLYNFEPKGEVRASALILHGLGTRNIKFLLWLGPHLASVGVNTSILILPGNYTRVENNSMSGKSFLYPDMNILYQFWEHAVVDTRTTIDFLCQNNMWKENNLLMGYCLGGMVSTIAASLEKERIAHTLYMTTGGHIPKIMYESPAATFVPNMIKRGFTSSHNLDNMKKLYGIYEKDFPLVKDMTLEELLNTDKVHPLLKIDPISYAHLLNMEKTTFIDAYFDTTLPVDSRKILYNEMNGANRKILPISHVNWLPFAYILAKYMLHKVNINDKESKKALLRSEIYENPLQK